MGNQTKINIQANRKINKLLEDVRYCEVGLAGCTGGWGLTNCHRHKRAFYYGRPEWLWNYNQVCRACLNCHMALEQDPDKTETIFYKLRGDDQLD